MHEVVLLYSEKILIVEDVGLIALDIKTMLVSIGFNNVKIAYNGPEAIKICKTFGPDLILMDIVLGEGMDGIQAGQAIKEMIEVPLIYITGSNDKETQKEVQSTLPFGIIIKPVHIFELETMVKSALGMDFNPGFNLQGI